MSTGQQKTLRSAAWLAAGLPLLPLLGVGFLNDDFVGLVQFAARGWRGVLDSFVPADFEFLRPLGFLLFRAELSLFGLRPLLFHAVHLALFVLAAWLAGRLALRLAGPEAARWAPALALLYPGRMEAAAWIAAGFDLLALVLSSTALLMAAAPGWDGRHSRGVWLAVLCFVAPLAKETAYVLPVAVVAWEALGVLGSAKPTTRVVRCAAGFVGALLALGFRLVALGGIGGYAAQPLAAALPQAKRLPEMLARVVFLPVNPTYGPASRILSVLCVLAVVVLLTGLVGARRRGAAAPVAAGLVLALVGLLPPLPYLDPGTMVWNQSRMVALPGLGVVLAAASVLASTVRRRAMPAGALLLAAWLGATTLNQRAWLGAARSRDALLGAIEEITRAPGPHWVWVAGPINDYRGAQLLGGRLAEAVRIKLAGRTIHVDSEFLQHLEQRPVGPAAVDAVGRRHALRFDPARQEVRAIDWSTPQAVP